MATDPATFDALARVRRRWLAAMFLSVLGGGMATLATTYLVYDQTRSVALTGLLAAAVGLPQLMLPGAATALAQRFGGTKTYIARYLASAIVGFAPVLLSAGGHLTVAALLIWSAAMSVIAGLTTPSSSLVQRMLAPAELLPELNAAAARNASLASVIGILAGGTILDTVGESWIFALNAFSFLPLAISVIPLLGRAEKTASARPRFGSAPRLLYGPDANLSLRAAVRFTTLCLAIGGYTVTLPAIARSVGATANLLSLLQAAAAVGGVATAAAIRRLHRRVRWGRVQRGCIFTAGLGIGVLACSDRLGGTPTSTLALGIAAVLPVGFALSVDRSILTALVQESTPPEKRAVFFTYYALIPMVATPVSQVVIGLLADQVSVSLALSVVAAVTLILVAIGPRLPIRAAFDELSRADDPPGHGL